MDHRVEAVDRELGFAPDAVDRAGGGDGAQQAVVFGAVDALGHRVAADQEREGGAALALLVGGDAVTERVNGAEHDRLLRAVAAAGAVDGIRREPELSVDGLDAVVHRELVDALVGEVRR